LEPQQLTQGEKMSDSVLKQVAHLQNLTYEQLRELWRTLNGGQPPAYNRKYIISRLAYRIQEIAYGGLSDDAREQMQRILKDGGFDANGCDSRVRRKERATRQKRDAPITGTRFVRDWNGHHCEVIAVHNGFEFEGRIYRSLTAVAKAITGTHWNGRIFFGLEKRGKAKS
jgi:hypothetical protein